MELLLRVLGPLAPRDLIAARAVCRGWHAAVETLEARDRSFRFACGITDIRHLVDTRAPSTILGEFIGGSESWSAFPCTCGALSDALDTTVFEDTTPTDKGVTRKNGAFACYGHAHSSSLPPGTWEALARERKLAAHMLALGARVWAEVHYLQFDHSHGGGIGRYWVPCWFWLPFGAVRPDSPHEVARLVKALIKYAMYGGEDSEVADPLPRLADRDSARAFYAEHDSDDDDDSGDPDSDSDELSAVDRWMATWRDAAKTAPVPDWVNDSYKAHSLRPRLRGWRRWQLDAHLAAARWRRHVSRRRASSSHEDEDEDEDEDDDEADEDEGEEEEEEEDDDDDNYTSRLADVDVGGVEWNSLSREASIAAMDRMVDALDRIKADVSALVRHSTVVDEMDFSWMGGISPSGHLIGAMTRCTEGD